MRSSWLLHGTPGHPLHPPLTDAAIGTYTFSVVAGLFSLLGVAEEEFAHGWWLALVVGLVFGGLSAVTGVADWLKLSGGTPLKRTATTHGLVNASASVAFALAAIVGHGQYADGEVGTLAYVLTLLGFGLLTLGGWLGGTIVFGYGMRVLSLEGQPAREAAAPLPTPEEEAAEKI